ncbi:EamA family transporter [Pseudonocardiaceae bacterium YIM PH 21723]|nr:EamA family transporter [Pseudonocardiaceae bacterium YIM PH 21723]
MASRAGWMALSVVYVVWGSTYLGMRYAVETLPAFGFAGVRFILAGLLLAVGLLIFKGPAALRLDRRGWILGLLTGFLMVLWGNGLVVVGEEQVSSGLAALLIAALPLFIVIMRRLFGERPVVATIGGVAVGFAGLTVLMLAGTPTGSAGAHGNAWWGPWLVLSAAIGWGMGTMLLSRGPKRENPFAVTVLQLIAGGVYMLFASVIRGEQLNLAAVSPRSWWAFGYLVIAALVALTCYTIALDRLPVSTVATYAYVNPVIAVLLGILLAGERFTPLQGLGGLLVCVAVVVVVRAESRAPKIASGTVRPVWQAAARGD